MQKLCRLLAQVPSLEITGFIPYPSNLLQNPSKPHPANTATLWGTHLLNLLNVLAHEIVLSRHLSAIGVQKTGGVFGQIIPVIG